MEVFWIFGFVVVAVGGKEFCGAAARRWIEFLGEAFLGLL